MHLTMKIYTVYDNKVDAHGTPIFFANEHEMKADFISAMRTLTPEQFNSIEYEIYETGTFDTQSGKITSHKAPKHLFNLRTLMPKEKESTV